MNLYRAQELDLRKLRVFNAVAEYEHFSRAAAALHISQPAVSVQIRELERHLGFALFERVGRGVRLTENGQLVRAFARRLLALSDELEEAIEETRALEGSQLCIGASTTPGAYLLPRVLSIYREQHPGVRITVEIANTAATAERLREGSLRLGLLGTAVQDPKLQNEPWVRDQLQLILTPGHPWAGACISGDKLAREPLIRREKGSATDEVATGALAAAGVSIRRGLVLGGNEAVKQAVANGLGIAFVSGQAIVGEMSDGRLAQCTVHGLSIFRTFQISRRRGARLNAAERAFLAVARTAADLT
jgi:DNA-binding transcriptional LysR family regulator